MNKRQTKKRLKKQIAKLQSDNELMRGIIADSPKMQELYDAYTKPLNTIHTTLPFQKYHSKRFLPPDRPYDAGFIVLFKQGLAKDLFESIKDNITYEIDTECIIPTITANIFVGRGDG